MRKTVLILIFTLNFFWSESSDTIDEKIFYKKEIEQIQKKCKIDDPVIEFNESGKVISISLNGMVNLSQSDIDFIGKLKELTIINAIESNIGDLELNVLNKLTKLEKVYLADTSVTTKKCSFLKDCSNLKWLYISKTEIDDDIFDIIKNCASLEKLSIGETKIVKPLGEILKMYNKIELLSFSLVKYNLEEIKKLEEANPKIVFFYKK